MTGNNILGSGTSIRFWTVFIWFFPQVLLTQLHGQSREPQGVSYLETGVPHITNYHPADYGENPMNWAVVEDDHGLVFVANLNGVLEYDGVSWRKIATPKSTWVLSLDKHQSGTIFVGSFGDFGYLAPDSAGALQFVSLLPYVAPEERDFTAVWRVHALPGGVYFWTSRRLFRWHNQRMQSWATAADFSLSGAIRDTLYIEERGTGMLKMVGDSLELVHDSKRFSPIVPVAMIPFDDHRALVCGRNGLLLYDGRTFTEYKSAANDFLRENLLSSAIALPDGRFVIGTYKGGACVVDRAGNIVAWLNKSTGVQNEDVKNLYCDSRGTVWMALSSGLTRVQLQDPFSFFTEAQGVKGNVVSVVRHRGRLYVATSQGVFYLAPAQPGTGSSANFKAVAGIEGQAWWLLSTGNGLLAGANGGVYKIEGTRAIRIQSEDAATFVLTRSERDTTLVFAGLKRGMEVVRFNGTEWEGKGLVPGIDEEIRTIVEDEQGVLWLGTIFQGVLRVSSLSRNKQGWDAKIERFGTTHGLPDGPANVTGISGNVVFATRKGHRKFDSAHEMFVPDSTVSIELADTLRSAPLANEDRFGRVFTWPRNPQRDVAELWMAVPDINGVYQIDKTRFRSLSQFGLLHTTYTDYDGVIWVGLSTGVARYDPKVAKDAHREFETLIRRIATIPGDSLIYGGAERPRSDILVLQSQYNALRFEYAAPFLDHVSENRYQYQLGGFDRDWSAWTAETRKDYTNLPGGDYTFHVRARNIYGHVGKEAGFAFEVLPPWYRSWWTIGVFILLGGGVIFGLVRLRVRSLEKKSKALEELVAQRTKLVTEQRNQLREQSEKLQEMDKLKSHFFANVSHEFRTPLTLILGLLEKFRESDNGNRTDYDIMHRNANRLLELINQLLDLSKLEAGGVKINARRDDLVRFLRRILGSFTSMAEQNQIELTFNNAPATAEVGHSAIFVYFDTDKLEKVFYNLLSNALKFTPAGGKVGITISSGALLENVDTECVEIQVSNTGPGIPAESLAYVFDRFYQAQSSSTRQYEGTGIGLALVKEIVELHRGEVSVRSAEGEETVFTVRLPLGRAHLRDEEIVDRESLEEERPVSGYVPPESMALESSDTEKEGAGATSDPDEAKPEQDETVVLVVEDHADLRQYIREHLVQEYTIVLADNGASGLQKALESIPDLVVSDIMMPEMDGYELCKALKTDEKTSHVPVILLTAKASSENKLEGLETGADDYLVKPFDPQELKVRVRNLIQSRQQLREKFSTEMLLRPSQVTVPSSHKVFLDRLCAVIEENLDDEDFNVEMLGLKVGMSRAQIHRKLRALTNQSASEFIRSFRLQRAAELIRQEAGNIAEIAYQVGFSSQAYFSRCFQEAFGCSPSQYRKRAQS